MVQMKYIEGMIAKLGELAKRGYGRHKKSISLKEVNMSVIDVGGEVREGEELILGQLENWLKTKVLSWLVQQSLPANIRAGRRIGLIV